MATKRHEQIAAAIVKRLYTNGFHEQGNRLVLQMGVRDLGGWCKDAVRRIVLDELARVRKGGR
jgi:hypothetical protein